MPVHHCCPPGHHVGDTGLVLAHLIVVSHGTIVPGETEIETGIITEVDEDHDRDPIPHHPEGEIERGRETETERSMPGDDQSRWI